MTLKAKEKDFSMGSVPPGDSLYDENTSTELHLKLNDRQYAGCSDARSMESLNAVL